MGEFYGINGMWANDSHLFVTDGGNKNIKIFDIHIGDVWEETVTVTITDNHTEYDTVTSQITEKTTEVITNAKSELDFPHVLSFLIQRLAKGTTKKFIMDHNFFVLASKIFLVNGEEITDEQLNKADLKSDKKIKIIRTVVSTLKQE